MVIGNLRLWYRYQRSGRSAFAQEALSGKESALYLSTLIKPVGSYIFNAHKTIQPEAWKGVTGFGKFKTWFHAVADEPLPTFAFWSKEDHIKMQTALEKLSLPKSPADYAEGAALYKAVAARHRFFGVDEDDIADAVYAYRRIRRADPMLGDDGTFVSNVAAEDAH